MTNERRKRIRRNRKKKEKNRIIIWFKNLSKKKKIALISVAIILLLLVVAIIFVASKFSKMQMEEIPDSEIVINDFVEQDVGVGYTNFVLFGSDSRTGEVEKGINTDAIIVVSLNNETKEVKMVSVYRDTLLDVANGNIQKCNSAYSRGGAKQAINMLNMNLDLDIQKYVTVDFGSVSDVIDLLGGIEINVSEAEMRAVNDFIGETAKATGKWGKQITHPGLQTLNGVQATTYARIRKGVGDDYARTARQRLVIEKTVEKATKAGFSKLNDIIDEVLPSVATNLTVTEILSYAKSLTKYKIGETTGFPMEKGSGTIPGKGSCVFPLTLKKNVSLLHEFLYGTENYQPSSKVVSISGTIAGVVGNRKVEPNTTWEDTGESTTGNDGSTTNPDGTSPDGTSSDGTSPDGTNLDGTNPDGTNPDGTNPDGTNPDGTNPDGTNSDGANPDGTNPDGTNPDGTNPDGTNPDGTNPDGTNPDGTGSENQGGSGNQGGTGDQDGSTGDDTSTEDGNSGTPNSNLGSQTPQQ